MPAVLTGTLIDVDGAASRAVDFSMAALAEGAEALRDWGLAPTRFTRFRGDHWQMYVSATGFGVRSALFMAACLRAAETGLSSRIAVGVGSVDRLDDDLGRASGAAFARSGKALDAMKRGRILVVDGLDADARMSAMLAMVDWMIQRWSREQAEAVALALDPARSSQAEIATRLGITRQAVQARLAGAGFQPLAAALAAIEA